VIEQRVALLRTGDQSDTARWLHRLAARCQGQLARRDRPPYAQRPKAPLVAAASEAMLAAVPGIATSSARALLDRFGSVVRVAEASFEEILRVPGIGPERAHALRAAFGDRAGRVPQAVPSLSRLSRDRVRVARGSRRDSSTWPRHRTEIARPRRKRSGRRRQGAPPRAREDDGRRSLIPGGPPLELGGPPFGNGASLPGRLARLRRPAPA
jgi:hypothetical protein